MDWLINILPYVPQYAIPIVVVAIAYKKIDSDRQATKTVRDKDSLTLHDSVQKLTWENGRIKEDVSFLKTGLDDHQMQLSVLNTELAKVSTKLDNVIEMLHDLKESKS